MRKAQTLVRKGKAIGDSNLRECIRHFSEAINIMVDISGETRMDNNSVVHQLCVTYCLLAICSLEARADSEQIFEDVKAALDLWLSPSNLNRFEEGDSSVISDCTVIVLYNII